MEAKYPQGMASLDSNGMAGRITLLSFKNIKIYLLIDAIFIWILQALKNDGIYKLVFCNILYYSKYGIELTRFSRETH